MIAKKYQDFDVFAANTSSHIGANWQRLRIDETLKTEMLIAFTRWSTLFGRYKDPSQRTPIVMDEIKIAYADLDKRLRGMVQ